MLDGQRVAVPQVETLCEEEVVGHTVGVEVRLPPTMLSVGLMVGVRVVVAHPERVREGEGDLEGLGDVDGQWEAEGVKEGEVESVPPPNPPK